MAGSVCFRHVLIEALIWRHVYRISSCWSIRYADRQEWIEGFVDCSATTPTPSLNFASEGTRRCSYTGASRFKTLWTSRRNGGCPTGHKERDSLADVAALVVDRYYTGMKTTFDEKHHAYWAMWPLPRLTLTMQQKTCTCVMKYGTVAWTSEKASRELTRKRKGRWSGERQGTWNIGDVITERGGGVVGAR